MTATAGFSNGIEWCESDADQIEIYGQHQERQEPGLTEEIGQEIKMANSSEGPLHMEGNVEHVEKWLSVIWFSRWSSIQV